MEGFILASFFWSLAVVIQFVLIHRQRKLRKILADVVLALLDANNIPRAKKLLEQELGKD